MRAFAFLVLLAACGGSGGASSAPAPSATTNPPIVPGECAVRCENLRPQLERDFSILNVNCGTNEILGALSNDECNCVFERQFGILVSGSFASPMSGSSRCRR